jgi:TatD DNase family protein
MLIDTHCHLNHHTLAPQIDALIARALDAGVGKIMNVGFDLESSRLAVAQAEKRPEVYAVVGVHPHDAKTWTSEIGKELRELAAHPRTVAIGEIGLDFHYDFSPVESQYAAFHAQLELAQELQLPYVIHCREAYDEVLGVIEESKYSQGVMHCWTVGPELAQRAQTLGLYIGFGGMVTFKKAEEVRQSAAMLNPDRLLLETDAPYMTPEPYRGKPNEPSYTKFVAERLATVLGTSLEEISDLTTTNAERLFHRLVQHPLSPQNSIS